MSGTIVVIILMSSGLARGPIGEALIDASREALGSSTKIDVRELEVSPSEEELLGMVATSSNTAVADVRFSDPVRTRATVRLCVFHSRHPSTRTFDFLPIDPEVERGRALGFAMASMLPPRIFAPPIGAIRVEPPSQTPPPKTPEENRASLYAAALASGPIDGDGGGVGGTIGGELVLTPALGLRLGLSAFFGEVDTAQASMSSFSGALGVRWWLIPGSDVGAFGLALRADGLVMYQALTHFSLDDPAPVREGRWLPGIDVLAEATYALSHSTQVVLGAGPELLAGKTEVFTHGDEVAVLPWARARFELGVRAGF